MRTPRTTRTRYAPRRARPIRRVLPLLLYWGLPTLVAGLTLMYFRELVAERQRGPEEVVSAPPQAEPEVEPQAEAEAEPIAKAMPADASKLDPDRFIAELRNRNAERLKAEAQARETEGLKRELGRLKLEADRARLAEERRREAEARRREAEAHKPKPVPVPEPVAPKPDPEVERLRLEAERQAELKRAVVQDLFERVVTCRASREPVEFRDALLKLKELRPTDPAIEYGLGEVYGSLGVTFSLKKARSAFRRFLDLTTAGKFDGTSFHPLYGFTANNIQDARMTVQQHLLKLGKKHRLLLVTSHRRLAKLETGLEKERETRLKRITKLEKKAADWRREIARGSRRKPTLLRWIRDYRILIAREEKQIEFVTAELVRIRDAKQQ